MSELDITLEGMNRGESHVNIVPAGTTIVDPANPNPQGGQTPPVNPAAVPPVNPQTPPANPEGASGEEPGQGTTPDNTNVEGAATPPATAEEVTTDVTVSNYLSGTEANLSQDELQDRDKLFSIYDVKGFDINRNLLDKDGNIVLMYSDVFNFVDKGVLPTNEEGKLVTSGGTVVENITYSSFC